MASTLTQSIFATTYKDDYRDSDNYHRILFNSGRALQARELTQMQTIIQSEINRFGRNIFKEGASVNPGGGTIDNNYTFVKLNTTTNTLPTTNIVSNIFTGQTSGLRAKILEVVPAEGTDPATIYVEYIGGVSGGVTTALKFTAGENITDGTTTLTVQTTDTVENSACGAGVRFSTATGEFFTRGHFVFTEQQSIILSKYNPVYNGVVGFKVTEDVVTVADNVNLYDNQGAVPNTTAPGADRYRIRLTLTDRVNVDSDEAFVYFAEIANSIIVNNVQGTDEYNKINMLLAKRTKEESGDYIVRPFILKFDEDSDNNFLIADISPGTAYVNGYRVDLAAPRKIRLQKPTTVATFNNQAVAANYGNYIVCSTTRGTPNINTVERWDLRSATGYGGSTIGTARVRAIEEDGAVYKYYLTSVTMSGTNNFRDVRSIGLSATKYADLVLENGIAVLKDAANNDLLFNLPNQRPQNLTDVSLRVQKRFTTTNSVGTATLGPGNLGTGETWADVNSWVVAVDSSGTNISSTVSITGSGSTTATISGIPVGNGATIQVVAYIDKSAGVVATKTMTETTRTASVVGGVLDLRKADVYDILRVRDSDSNGADLSGSFRFDNGQHSTFYDMSRLLLRSTVSAPTRPVFVRFRYFSHGAGDFFAATSYDSSTTGLTYGQIPTHTLNDGTVVNLRDVLDFRPRIGDLGTTFDSATASIKFLPRNTDIIRADVNYYLPRYDKLTVSDNGTLSFVQGVPAFAPSYPPTPENSLELYKIKLNANTFNDSDLSISAIDHKRYTMADIGALEKRIDRLEEYTTLSLLELETSAWSVVDSTGIPRTKAGFLADGFSDHFFSDLASTEYRASIDPREKIVRPPVISKNIRLKFDSSLSSNMVLRGDNVYLDYNEVEYIVQPFVSGSENINPFHVINTIGQIEISPASDEWKDTVYVPARTINGGTRLSTDTSQLFNEWQWQWQGTTAGSQVGNVVNRSTTSSSSVSTAPTSQGGVATTRSISTTTVISRIVADETIRQVVGDRVVDVALVPFMRSRKVHFKASGLKPFQQYFAFFDNVPVSSWVREEAFVRFATTSTDFGNRHNNAAQHPEGPTTLETDANGVIEGSFFIPNTSAIRFRTGTREFKLMNVSSSNEADATSLGAVVYSATGVLETRQQDILSTRLIAIRNFSSTDVQTSTTIVNPPPPPPPEPPRPQVPVVPVLPVLPQPPRPPVPPPPPVRPNPPPVREGDRGRDGPGRSRDPLAQTFFVTNNEGVFLTRVAIFFKTKPTDPENPTTVTLEIRPVVNGFPSAVDVVPGSTVHLTPSQVNLPAAQTQAAVTAAPTYFTFAEPLYLNGNTEYCIVLLTGTTDYNVYVSEADAFVLGSTEKRITQQPSLGSLFKSQNARTWTPDQTKDLAFGLYRADFVASSGFAVLENVDVPPVLLDENPIQVTSGSRWATVFHPHHGFDSGDFVDISGLDSATTYGGVLGTSINGFREVSFPDASGYQIYMDSAANVSRFTGSNNVLATNNIMYDIVNPSIDTLVPLATNIGASARFTTGRSLAGNETRFVKDAFFNNVVIKEDNVSNTPLMIANAGYEQLAPLNGARSATVKIDVSSTSSFVSPVIDMQRSSLILVNNLIDKQDSDRDRVGFNTPIIFVDETHPFDGTHVAKHVTVPVSLAETATGLQVVLSANRPTEADFLVYYRTATTGELIRQKNWELVNQDVPVPADENPNVFREYRYLIGGRNGRLTPFTEYQLKIVFRSTNSSRVPTLTDLRVIALAD